MMYSLLDVTLTSSDNTKSDASFSKTHRCAFSAIKVCAGTYDFVGQGFSQLVF